MKIPTVFHIFGFSVLFVSMATLLLVLIKIFLYGEQRLVGHKTIVFFEILFVIFGIVFLSLNLKKVGVRGERRG